MDELELDLRDCLESVGEAQGRLSEWLAALGLPVTSTHRAEIVFEELATNIAMHGYPAGGSGGNAFHGRVRVRPSHVEVVLEDRGIAFDPRAGTSEPLQGSIEDIKIGGLGLVLVRKFASRIDYVRSADGVNRLEVDVGLGEPSR